MNETPEPLLGRLANEGKLGACKLSWNLLMWILQSNVLLLSSNLRIFLILK